MITKPNKIRKVKRKTNVQNLRSNLRKPGKMYFTKIEVMKTIETVKENVELQGDIEQTKCNGCGDDRASGMAQAPSLGLSLALLGCQLEDCPGHPKPE
jgi:hypothetical protein